MKNLTLNMSFLLGLFAATTLVLPASAAENCQARKQTDSNSENPPPPTGGVGTGGEYVSFESPTAVRVAESESPEPTQTELNDSCGATVTEGSASQAKELAMTVLNKINNLRSRSGNTNQTAGLNFSPLGGAASADNALLDDSRLSLFSFTEYTKRDREATASSGGYDQESNAITIGFDYRVDEASFAGMSISVSDGDSDLDSRLGGSEVSSLMLGSHGAKYWDSHYISAFLAYGAIDIDVDRSTTSDAFSASTEGDYWYADFTVGADYDYGPLRLNPSVRALFMRGEVDSYTERSASGSGAVRSVNAQDIDSTVLSLAVQADYSLLQSWGVLSPSVRAEFNFDQGDAYKTNGQTLNDADKSFLASISDQSDEPDSSTLALSFGVAAQFKRGLAAYAAYERLLMHDYMNKYTATIGLRIELP
ncbi:hypothetical protein DOK_04312 [gamma proteobacterium BDW918]|uniref:Autotransporter domain-containing protein n=1 Tax=Zhongshania aliphaticivorans TaxID=1470434 RepID=A0A127M4M9_9GAMM|nr:autotransporter outer membrane beta-barrel domain-containing protein [Zhongshania aliphaticivorans]AMO68200.1 hypothetical protein AZF00_07740 [Zhongshania aliphaticivorans]EIF44312.1 hypothetical protein DOK_04312 [gamma proteobacterium BDW918]